MVHEEIIQRVQDLAAPILSVEGFELVEIEYRREARGWVLRLYVDKEGGITLDDCSRVSREIGRILDVEDFILTPYTLEISSPGLTRPLKTEKDFIKYHHRMAKVTTNQPIRNRRTFKGKILGIREGRVEIEVGGELFLIPLPTIVKAHLELEF